jgi:hypothetical protein
MLKVQGLMRLSIERPKAFGAAFLTPPQNWRALRESMGCCYPLKRISRAA